MDLDCVADQDDFFNAGGPSSFVGWGTARSCMFAITSVFGQVLTCCTWNTDGHQRSSYLIRKLAAFSTND